MESFNIALDAEELDNLDDMVEIGFSEMCGTEEDDKKRFEIKMDIRAALEGNL